MEAAVTRVEMLEVALEGDRPTNDVITPLTIEQLMMVGGGECVVNAI